MTLDKSGAGWDGSRGKVMAGGRDAADYLGVWKTFKATYDVDGVWSHNVRHRRILGLHQMEQQRCSASAVEKNLVPCILLRLESPLPLAMLSVGCRGSLDAGLAATWPA